MYKQKHIQIRSLEERILLVRGQRVILDGDLADVYGVETKVLNQAVKRNKMRFPDDFVFRLTKEEFERASAYQSTASTGTEKRSQIVTAWTRNIRFLPYAFTEHGAIMAANVLHSTRALEMSVFVVRAFVRLRQGALLHHELAARLKELETRVGKHDEDIKAIIEAIRQLMAPPDKPKKEIGFKVGEPRLKYRTKAERRG
jgi:hypothetical protein